VRHHIERNHAKLYQGKTARWKKAEKGGNFGRPFRGGNDLRGGGVSEVEKSSKVRQPSNSANEQREFQGRKNVNVGLNIGKEASQLTGKGKDH